jgi:hypothetical protein
MDAGGTDGTLPAPLWPSPQPPLFYRVDATMLLVRGDRPIVVLPIEARKLIVNDSHGP